MLCVYKFPGSPAELRETEGSLAALQGLVGGYLELAPVNGGSVYCDEEGVLKGLEPNVILERVGTVHGPVLVLGPADADGNETALDAEGLERWRKLLDRSAVR